MLRPSSRISRHFLPGLVLALLACLTLAGRATTTAQGTFAGIPDSLEYDSARRTYTLYLPPQTDEAPLVIALHATASSGTAMAAQTKLHEAANARGWAVAYPDSLALYWDDGRTSQDLGEEPVDDSGFIVALIDSLAERYAIDPAQVYLTGIDGGGRLAYGLACQQPDTFAGVAVVSALMRERTAESDCAETTEPVNLLVVHGDDDRYEPERGLTGIMSLREVQMFWSARSGCGEPATSSGDVLSVTTYAGCAGETLTAVARISGAGHVWPRTGGYALDHIGVDASDLIVRFLAGDPDWADVPVTPDPDPEETGPQRAYRFFAPISYDPAQPIPVVFVLHGTPGTGLDMAFITGMNAVAAREGFIAVYPDANDLRWDYRTSLVPTPQTPGLDDVVFLETLVDDLAIDFNIDRQRIYVTGFSNGGFMTQRLACDSYETFAAFAVVGATAYPDLPALCASAPGLAIMFIHGTADRSVPWQGLTEINSLGQEVYLSWPVPQSVGFWVDHNACDTTADYVEVPKTDESAPTRVIINTFDGCDNDNPPVVFYLIEGGGHNWPGHPGFIGQQVAGDINMDIDASEEIWTYFTGYTLGMTGGQ